MKYKCDKCLKEFDQKYNYIRHLKRKITCKHIINDILDLNTKNNIEEETTDNKIVHLLATENKLNEVNCPKLSKIVHTSYTCLICYKNYLYDSSLCKHKRKHHPNYEEDTKKVIDDTNNKKILMIEQELLTTKLKLEEVLNTLNNKQNITPIQNNTNNNSHNNINANTNVNIFTDFGQEKLEMLTLEDKKDICSQPCDSIFKIVKKMHVNKDLPDYMNICVENLRSNIMYAIEKNKFIAKDKSITLFDVIHTAGYRLREILTNEENTKDISDERKESLKTLYNFILRYDPDNEDLDGTIIL
jgi:hypothetical protein